MTKTAKFLLFFSVLVLLTLGTLLVAPFIGMTKVTVAMLVDPSYEGIEKDIFWRIRIPRTLVSFVAGCGLALSGMAFQAMFRNPLATPFTLGVSAGASLGAAMYVRLGIIFSVAGASGISIFAFMGALLSVALLYGLTTVSRNFSTATMLLAGVAISFFFSSVILFTQYISDHTQSYRIVRWLMGGFEVSGFDSLFNMLPFVVTGGAILLYMTKELNLITTGDEIAISRGVDIKKVKNVIFFATSMMVGGVVAISGPIGFVGMMSPHICRLIIGPNHQHLTPATLLFGGVFLTVCDTIARSVIAPAEIPVGVVTALIGGPFFVWLLLSGVLNKGIFYDS